MCNILGQHEITSDEALSLLKPYVKNNMPTVVLKALTVRDPFTPCKYFLGSVGLSTKPHNYTKCKFGLESHKD